MGLTYLRRRNSLYLPGLNLPEMVLSWLLLRYFKTGTLAIFILLYVPKWKVISQNAHFKNMNSMKVQYFTFYWICNICLPRKTTNWLNLYRIWYICADSFNPVIIQRVYQYPSEDISYADCKIQLHKTNLMDPMNINEACTFNIFIQLTSMSGYSRSQWIYSIVKICMNIAVYLVLEVKYLCRFNRSIGSCCIPLYPENLAHMIKFLLKIAIWVYIQWTLLIMLDPAGFRDPGCLQASSFNP